MNGFTTVQPSLSIETPTTANPLCSYFFANSMYHGISTLQPVHQVAQKSSRTTLPLYPDNLVEAPFESSSVKSGAALPTAMALRFLHEEKTAVTRHTKTSNFPVNSRDESFITPGLCTEWDRAPH